MLDWLRLIRASGLATVASNAIAAVAALAFAQTGGLDATWAAARIAHDWQRACWVLLASFLLYASGMAWNDIVDIDRDRKGRPDRPLPSGRIGLAPAYIAGVLLPVAALACAAQVEYGFQAGGAVLCLALLYNFASKDLPWAGALNLALVRVAHAIFALLLFGSDLLKIGVLGGGDGPWPWTYPAIIGLYIFGLALLAEQESRRGRRWELLVAGGFMAVAVLWAVLRIVSAAWIGQVLRLGPAGPLILLVCFLPALGVLALLGMRVGRAWWKTVVDAKCRKVGPAVGAALGGIILIDALVVLAAHPLVIIPVAMCYLAWLALGAAIRMD